MSDVFISLNMWMHALATSVFIGYYLVMVGIILPAIERAAAGTAGMIIAAISKHSRGWLYAAAIVLSVTGIVLMLVNPAYLGIGNFSNPWSLLMLAKHAAILGMAAAGFWFNAIRRVGPGAISNSDAAGAVRRFRAHAQWMAIAGALVLLLTALSQAQ